MRPKRAWRRVEDGPAGGSQPGTLERVLAWASGVGQGDIAIVAWLTLAVRRVLGAMLRIGRR